MARIQTSGEIQSLLTRLEGETISLLQVLGVNSLKSMTAMPEALTGETVAATLVDDRRLTVVTSGHRVVFDLQLTGKLVWQTSAVPYAMTSASVRPTVRLILVSGQGLDLTEPAKTKRITVTISPHP